MVGVMAVQQASRPCSSTEVGAAALASACGGRLPSLRAAILLIIVALTYFFSKTKPSPFHPTRRLRRRRHRHRCPLYMFGLPIT